MAVLAGNCDRPAQWFEKDPVGDEPTEALSARRGVIRNPQDGSSISASSAARGAASGSRSMPRSRAIGTASDIGRAGSSCNDQRRIRRLARRHLHFARHPPETP
jgi:hypothetical protein